MNHAALSIVAASRKCWLITGMIVLGCFFTQPAVHAASARAKGWVKLGSAVVRADKEREVVPVKFGGTVQKIEVEVRRSGLNIKDIRLHLRDGGMVEVPIRAAISKDKRTRTIELPRPVHGIVKIELFSQSWRGPQAEAIVWGKKR